MATNDDEPINLHGDRIRFLCEQHGDAYKLYMGNNMYREFNDETLPSEIKSLLGMINAFDWDKLHSEHVGAVEQMLGKQHRLLTPVLWSAGSYYPEVSHDIGWRMGNSYALIVSYKYFLKLKGETES